MQNNKRRNPAEQPTPPDPVKPKETPWQAKGPLTQQVLIAVLVVAIGVLWGMSPVLDLIKQREQGTIQGISPTELTRFRETAERLERILSTERFALGDLERYATLFRQAEVGREEGLMPKGDALRELTDRFLDKKVLGDENRTYRDALAEYRGDKAVRTEDLQRFLQVRAASEAIEARHLATPAIPSVLGQAVAGLYKDALEVVQVELSTKPLLEPFREKAAADSAAIEKAYAEFKDRFYDIPPACQVTCYAAKPDSIAKNVKAPPDDELRKYYEDNKTKKLQWLKPKPKPEEKKPDPAERKEGEAKPEAGKETDASKKAEAEKDAKAKDAAKPDAGKKAETGKDAKSKGFDAGKKLTGANPEAWKTTHDLTNQPAAKKADDTRPNEEMPKAEAGKDAKPKPKDADAAKPEAAKNAGKKAETARDAKAKDADAGKKPDADVKTDPAAKKADVTQPAKEKPKAGDEAAKVGEEKKEEPKKDEPEYKTFEEVKDQIVRDLQKERAKEIAKKLHELFWDRVNDTLNAEGITDADLKRERLDALAAASTLSPAQDERLTGDAVIEIVEGVTIAKPRMDETPPSRQGTKKLPEAAVGDLGRMELIMDLFSPATAIGTFCRPISKDFRGNQACLRLEKHIPGSVKPLDDAVKAEIVTYLAGRMAWGELLSKANAIAGNCNAGKVPLATFFDQENSKFWGLFMPPQPKRLPVQSGGKLSRVVTPLGDLAANETLDLDGLDVVSVPLIALATSETPILLDRVDPASARSKARTLPDLVPTLRLVQVLKYLPNGEDPDKIDTTATDPAKVEGDFARYAHYGYRMSLSRFLEAQFNQQLNARLQGR